MSVLVVLLSCLLCPGRLRQRDCGGVGVRSQGVENHAIEAGTYIPQGRRKAVECLFLLRSPLPEPFTGPGHIRRFACQAICYLLLWMTRYPPSYDLIKVVLYHFTSCFITLHRRATQHLHPALIIVCLPPTGGVDLMQALLCQCRQAHSPQMVFHCATHPASKTLRSGNCNAGCISLSTDRREEP